MFKSSNALQLLSILINQPWRLKHVFEFPFSYITLPPKFYVLFQFWFRNNSNLSLRHIIMVQNLLKSNSIFSLWEDEEESVRYYFNFIYISLSSVALGNILLLSQYFLVFCCCWGKWTEWFRKQFCLSSKIIYSKLV